jgi:hypothetical protein
MSAFGENFRPVLSSKRASHNKKTANVIRGFIWKRKNNWSRVPDGGLIPGETGRMAVGSKLTLTLTRSRSFAMNSRKSISKV